MTAEAIAPGLPVKARRISLALLFALFSPIAGYLYVGRPRRALVMAAIWLAFYASMHDGLGGWLAQPGPWTALVATAFGLALFAAIDTFRIARGERGYRLRGYNRVWIYVGVTAVVALALEAAFNPAWGGFLAVKPFSTPSGSMAPTLEVGDYAVGDMRAYQRAAPQPGDVALFEHDGVIWVKRIIAGPGDTVALIHGVVHVNGVPARLDPIGGDDPPRRAIETLANETSHVIMPNRNADLPQADEMAKVTVPADNYFVLGDNRGNSLDSRFPDFGFMPRAQLIGRMTFIYWSHDRRRIGAIIP